MPTPYPPSTERLRLLLAGIAAGDAAGKITEFMPSERTASVYEERRAEGFPFIPVAGGPFNWQASDVTDDTQMAWAITQACIEAGGFNPEAIAQAFIDWLDSNPPDVGGTTRQAINNLKAGVPWHEAGYRIWQQNPESAANGSLMRNGVIPGLASSLDECFSFTAHHSMMTHYGGGPGICCLLHSWLIWRLLDGWRPDEEGRWLHAFNSEWGHWSCDRADGITALWDDRGGHQIGAVMTSTLETLPWNKAKSPFDLDYAGRIGYCALSLQIAVWFLHASLLDDTSHLWPDWMPHQLRSTTGPDVLGLVAMVGYDADTYAAIAGPLIAAAHGAVPESMIEGLTVMQEFDTVSKSSVPCDHQAGLRED